MAGASLQKLGQHKNTSSLVIDGSPCDRARRLVVLHMLVKALLAKGVARLHNHRVLKRAGADAARKAPRVQMVRLVMFRLCTLLCHACFGVQLVQHPFQDVCRRAALNLLESFLQGGKSQGHSQNRSTFVIPRIGASLRCLILIEKRFSKIV